MTHSLNNPQGSIRVVQINEGIFYADTQGIKLSINDQCVMSDEFAVIIIPIWKQLLTLYFCVQ